MVDFLDRLWTTEEEAEEIAEQEAGEVEEELQDYRNTQARRDAGQDRRIRDNRGAIDSVGRMAAPVYAAFCEGYGAEGEIDLDITDYDVHIPDQEHEVEAEGEVGTRYRHLGETPLGPTDDDPRFPDRENELHGNIQAEIGEGNGPERDGRFPASRVAYHNQVTAWDSEDPNDLLAELSNYERNVSAIYDRQPETAGMSRRMKENIAMMWAANEAGRPMSLLGAARKWDSMFPAYRLQGGAGRTTAGNGGGAGNGGAQTVQQHEDTGEDDDGEHQIAVQYRHLGETPRGPQEHDPLLILQGMLQQDQEEIEEEELDAEEAAEEPGALDRIAGQLRNYADQIGDVIRDNQREIAAGAGAAAGTVYVANGVMNGDWNPAEMVATDIAVMTGDVPGRPSAERIAAGAVVGGAAAYDVRTGKIRNALGTTKEKISQTLDEAYDVTWKFVDSITKKEDGPNGPVIGEDIILEEIPSESPVEEASTPSVTHAESPGTEVDTEPGFPDWETEEDSVDVPRDDTDVGRIPTGETLYWDGKEYEEGFLVQEKISDLKTSQQKRFADRLYNDPHLDRSAAAWGIYDSEVTDEREQEIADFWGRPTNNTEKNGVRHLKMTMLDSEFRTCPSCGKIRKTRHSMAGHQVADHGMSVCSECREEE